MRCLAAALSASSCHCFLFRHRHRHRHCTGSGTPTPSHPSLVLLLPHHLHRPQHAPLRPITTILIPPASSSGLILLIAPSVALVRWRPPPSALRRTTAASKTPANRFPHARAPPYSCNRPRHCHTWQGSPSSHLVSSLLPSAFVRNTASPSSAMGKARSISILLGPAQLSCRVCQR